MVGLFATAVLLAGCSGADGRGSDAAVAADADSADVSPADAGDAATGAQRAPAAAWIALCGPTTQPLPRVERSGDDVVLVLPPVMADALARHAPGFTPQAWSSFHEWVADVHAFGCNEAPSAVVADLNADGRADLAALGISGSRALYFFLLSTGDGYEYIEQGAHAIGADYVADPYYFIHRVGPGSYASRYGPFDDPELPPVADDGLQVLDLTHDAIGWVYLEKAAGITYWRSGRLHDFAIAD